MSRRIFAGKLVTLGILMLLALLACTKEPNLEQERQPLEHEAETASPDARGHVEERAGAVEPLGKYDPPIEISTVRILGESIVFPEGQSIHDNVWYQDYRESLGINLTNKWVVSHHSGEQKMNISIASGDLPDFFAVNAIQLKRLAEADMIMDLTDVFEEYATPLTREILAQNPTSLPSATLGGKLMAIPNTQSAVDYAHLIWVRTDWLEALKLPEPRTMEDLLNISAAFAQFAPNGTKQANTVGLILTKDLIDGYGGYEGFMQGYHAYPMFWIKDETGKLVYGSIQPEVREALLQLQKMYKQGQIDREFGVKDMAKAAEAAAAGNNGLAFGQMWNALWPLLSFKDHDSASQWQAYPLVSADGRPARPGVKATTTEYYVVKKGTAHPEAVIKILNLFIERIWGERTTLEQFEKLYSSNGIEHHNYAAVQAWPSRKNLDIYLKVTEALRANEPSKLNMEQLHTYNRIQTHLNGTGGAMEWAYERVFGEQGSLAVINQYVTDDLLVYDEFYGLPTPTMVEKGTILKKIEIDVFTKIIMGHPIENFDKFVRDWWEIGGSQITQEVNKWYVAEDRTILKNS